MTIRVLRRHIKEGKPKASCDCPIALALKERTGNSWNVGKYFIHSNKRVGPLPQVARHFVSAFDNGAPVKPFTFKLNL